MTTHKDGGTPWPGDGHYHDVSMLPRLRTFAIGAILVGSGHSVTAQPQGEAGLYSDVVIEGSILEPAPVTVASNAELADMIRAPDGFAVEVVGRDFGNTRMFATHGDHVYVTRSTEGDVIRLDDDNGDGTYEGFTTLAARPGMHGIAIDGDSVFLATVNDVYTAPINEDGTFGALTRIIDNLPDGGQHPNRTIAIGPDDMLWISVGSTCNACAETNPENATMLRANKDGTGRMIFASGLRNTIGFGFEPTTGELYGSDHGIDWLGDDAQLEEFNRIEQGKQYGWPYVYDFSQPNPADNPPGDITLDEWAQQSTEPVLGYTAHSAPMQMVFYTGTAFPEEYQGDAFIAMRGSWNRRPPSGYEIARVDFDHSAPQAWDTFAEGFLIEREDDGFEYLARFSGITQTPEGALLLADDANGNIYRITYQGDTETAGTLPANPPNAIAEPAPSDLAINLVEAEGTVEVTSDFTNDGMISIEHSADGHNASPPLNWASAPDGARSYVVIIDDPDADKPKPFTHWIAYDIPGMENGLREGVPTAPVVPEPQGMKQGVNSRGHTGYYGPRPPLGDPPHHYHFQVFALDVAELAVGGSPTRDEVLAAMEGHVLAKGELVGLFQRPAEEEVAH